VADPIRDPCPKMQESRTRSRHFVRCNEIGK
jgi:hypothetical protein